MITVTTTVKDPVIALKFNLAELSNRRKYSVAFSQLESCIKWNRGSVLKEIQTSNYICKWTFKRFQERKVLGWVKVGNWLEFLENGCPTTASLETKLTFIRFNLVRFLIFRTC